MKLDVPANVLASSGLQQTSQFKIQTSAHAFKILSSGLYSDKLGAVLREIGCNAADAHIAAGIPDEPFEVHLPTRLVNTFYIRDFGQGMSPDAIRDLYTTYFGSSKSQSNDFTGGFGLGSKSPFAYTDRFTITSWHNGVKTMYAAYIGDDGAPNISRVADEPMEPGARTGLMVSMPIKPLDTTELYKKAQQIYAVFRVPPTMLNAPPIQPRTYAVETPKWAICANGVFRHRVTVVMGNVEYPVPMEEINSLPVHTRTWAMTMHPELRCAIGEVDIAVSREQLEFTQRTRSALAHALRCAAAEHTKQLYEQLRDQDLSTIDSMTQFRNKLRNDTSFSLWRTAAELHSLPQDQINTISMLLTYNAALTPADVAGLEITDYYTVSTRTAARALRTTRTQLRKDKYDVPLLLPPALRVLIVDGAKYRNDRLRTLQRNERIWHVSDDPAVAKDFAQKCYNLPTVKLSDIPLPTGWIAPSKRPRKPRVKKTAELEVPTFTCTPGAAQVSIHESLDDVLQWKGPNYYVTRYTAWGQRKLVVDGQVISPADVLVAFNAVRKYLPNLPTRIAALTHGEIQRFKLDAAGWKPITAVVADLESLRAKNMVDDYETTDVPGLYGNNCAVFYADGPASFMSAHAKHNTALWKSLLQLVPKSKLLAEARVLASGGVVGITTPQKPIGVKAYNECMRQLHAPSKMVTAIKVADTSGKRYPLFEAARNGSLNNLVETSVGVAARLLAAVIIADETGNLPEIDCTQLAA